jgi:hypothetical protein
MVRRMTSSTPGIIPAPWQSPQEDVTIAPSRRRALPFGVAPARPVPGCARPLVVELGPVGDANREVAADEPDGDQFKVIAERVVEVERRLAERTWPGRSRDDDAVLGETIHPPEQVPGTDGERDVRVHRRDRNALGIFEDVKARAARQGQLQVSGMVLLDVLELLGDP